MSTYRKYLRRMVLTVAAGIAAGAGRLHAQRVSQPRWTLTSSATTIRVGLREGWGYGPELALRFTPKDQWGAGLTISLPAFGTDAGGAAADLGVTYTLPGERTELGGTAGLTAFLVGDNSDLTGGGVGGFAGGHITGWLTHGLGVTVSAKVRVTSTGAYPSMSAGLAVRF